MNLCVVCTSVHVGHECYLLSGVKGEVMSWEKEGGARALCCRGWKGSLHFVLLVPHNTA